MRILLRLGWLRYRRISTAAVLGSTTRIGIIEEAQPYNSSESQQAVVLGQALRPLVLVL